MRDKRSYKSIWMACLSLLVLVAMLSRDAVTTVCADPAQEKQFSGNSSHGIKNPTAPDDEDDPWTGSYVWFGKYEGAPVKYRVLTNNWHDSDVGMISALFLDCDSILFEAPFDSDGCANGDADAPNEWIASDIRKNLNGNGFLTRANGFTEMERNAIVQSRTLEHDLIAGTGAGEVAEWTQDTFEKYVPLNRDYVFLLDCEDVSNSAYGYYYDDEEAACRIKNDEGGANFWWLRSAHWELDRHVGTVAPDGIEYEAVNSAGGVSPALMVNTNEILFASVVSGTAGQDNAEYKLTLRDYDLWIYDQDGESVSASGRTITVPYAIEDDHADDATRVSILIKKHWYSDGEVLYYGKLDTGATFQKVGVGTFTLPSGLSLSGWGRDYYVYMFAEIENGIHESDYGSNMRELNIPVPVVEKQPVSVNSTVGATVQFNVEVRGVGPMTYQWQSRKNASASWSNSGLSSAKTNTLSVTTSAGLDGWEFRCVIKDGNGHYSASQPAKLSVDLKITKQPENVGVLAGATAKFTVAATGKAPITYQWQSRKNASASWSNSGQSGAKTATLSVNALAGLNGWQFRCVVTDGKGKKLATNPATLAVGQLLIATQPKNVTTTAGTTAKFTVEAAGPGTLTYQWQSRKNASASWSNSGQSGAKTKTLSVSTIDGLHGWQFRCIIKDGYGHQKTSSTVTLTLVPKITKHPEMDLALPGQKAHFYVEATGKAPLSYQWQSRKNSSSAWSNSGQSGAKTPNLTVSMINGLDGWEFRCVVTDANGQKAYSKEAVLKKGEWL